MLVSGSSPRPSTLDQLISAELCARLDRIDILSRKIFAGKLQGERRSKRRGQSVEFEDYRNYVPGDDLRHVDWNIFARLEKFFIKIFQEEEDLAVHIVLDATASMDAGTPSKLTLSMRLAMALAYVAIVNNDRVHLSIFNGAALRRIGPLRGRRNVQRIGAFLLAETQPAGVSAAGVSNVAPADTDTTPARERETPDAAASANENNDANPAIASTARGDFTSALRTIASARSGKGVMIVLSDFLVPGGYHEGLRMLAGGGGGGRSGAGSGGGGGGGYDTYCLQVLSPGELDPSTEGAPANPPSPTDSATNNAPTGREFVGDMRLVDAETGRATEITITADVIRQYKKTVAAYMDELKKFCATRDMNFGMLRSDSDVETLLLDYLRKRGLLR